MKSSPVQVVITLASPHKRSPIILDEYISSFYQNVTDPIRPDITFVNLAGGFSDLLVPTTLTDSKDETNIYAVVSTSVTIQNVNYFKLYDGEYIVLKYVDTPQLQNCLVVLEMLFNNILCVTEKSPLCWNANH